MALQKQNVPIRLAGGVDTKTDPKQVVSGKLLLLENGIFTSLNRIKKRNGYMSLPQDIENSLSTVTQGAALATFKNELNLFSSNELYSFSESTQKWSDKGIAASFSIASKPVIRNTNQQTTCDAAYHSSGLELFTWEDSSGGSRYSIIDSITGESIVSDKLITSTAVKPKPFALGNFLVIFYIEPVLHHIHILSLAVTNPSAIHSTITAATNVNIANPNYDATVTSTRVYFAYNTSIGGGGITINFLNAFLSLATPKTELTEVASSCIGVTIDPTLVQMWVSYHNGTQTKYFIHDGNPVLSSVLAPTIIQANSNTINNIAVYANNGSGSVFYTQNASATYNNFIITANLTNTGTVSGLKTLIRSVGIAAKPFLYNNVVYLTIAFDSVLQPTYFVINTRTVSAVAKFSPGLGGGLLKKNMVPEVSPALTGTFLIPSLIKDLFTTISGAVYTQTGVNSTILDFVTPGAFDNVELGENLLITGGLTYMYDGISITEFGFNIFPENVTNASSPTGGSIEDGTREYSVVYQWMDNQGQTHYSAPSIGLTVVNTGGNLSSNVLTIPTLRITDKKPPVRAPVTIAVYRTEDSGTTFYLVSSVASPILNDVTIDTVTFTDTLADTAIIGNPILYTTGGVLDNIAPPAANFVTTYKDRVILLPSENTNQWWPSKQVVPGVPVEFSDALAQNMDEAGGKLVAAARMDSLLILLKESLLYYVTGTGPDATGAQDDFSDAQPIACDGGCIDKKSVVLTPAGLLFKSQKGIYILNRQLGVTYIGADVEAYNPNTIVSANLIEDTQQVRFCLDNGTALVYDYYVNQWSVFTNHNAADSVIFQGVFTYLQPGGIVMQETPGQFTDNGKFIKLKLTTAWLSFAGLQSFQRVYRLMLLGEYVSPHNLQVSIAYDFNPFATQVSLIQAGVLLQTGVYGSDSYYGQTTPYGGAFPQYQFYSKLDRQKCETLQISIEDVQTPGYGENVALSALAFEVGQKKGLDKLGATNSFD